MVDISTVNKTGGQTGKDTDTVDDPLLDCLILLAEIFGKPITRTSIRAGLPLVDNKLTVELFSRAANRADLSSRVIRRSLEDLTNLELPAILLLKSGKASVVVKKEETGSVKILLPESGMGEEDISLEDIQELYTGYIIFAHPKYHMDSISVSDADGNNDNWFWDVVFSSWRVYRDVLVASFLINLFGLASPFFILNVYDRVVPNNAFETLWVLAIGIGIIYIFEFLMLSLRGYFIDIAGKKSELKISAMIFEKVMGLRMEAKPKSVGAFSKNLQEFDSVRNFITSFSITALIDLPFVFLGMFAIWYIAGSMVWISIFSSLILLMYAFIIQIPLKKAVVNTFKAGAKKNAIVVEGLSGVETIKVLGAESQIQQSVEESVSYIAKWGTYARLFSSSVVHVATFMQNFAVVAIVIAGVYMISEGQLTQGGLIACIILSRRVLGPMSKVANLATRYHKARTALEALNKVMSAPQERPHDKRFLHRSMLQGKIEMRNVSFSYPGQLNDALTNITLKIEPGEHVAIIGPTGSGKTTIGKLILGLYEPKKGMVLMDDTDLKQIDLAELRQFIGYVPQDVNLFQGSVRENIIMGTHDISDDVILESAKIAGVTEFVNVNPLGYDMQVGEQGRELSGGQRQSVAIARSIILDPPIYLFDEPSSSMDNKTESRLIRQLSSIVEGETLVLITHRSSVLKLVDRIVVIDNGKIVADGPKSQVLSTLKSDKLPLQ